MCIKSFDNAPLIFEIFGQKNLQTMKIIQNVWDFYKVFQHYFHLFRDAFLQKILRTFDAVYIYCDGPGQAIV